MNLRSSQHHARHATTHWVHCSTGSRFPPGRGRRGLQQPGAAQTVPALQPDLVFPWGIFDDFGIWTIPISVVIAYLVTAGEGIAAFVEEPFGVEEDHLDLDRICLAIDQSVSQVLVGP